MPVNPMQRRARNSFLIGFLVALVIMALVVLALLYQIKSIKEAKEQIEKRQMKVLVAADNLESGEKVTMESFITSTVQTTVPSDQIVSDDDFLFYDAEGNPVTKYNDDGSERQKEVIIKVSVPAGTIVTKDMIEEVDNPTTDDQRIVEYNMILLPSQLKNGDYIDIRYSIPTGEDYIVISKKKVEATTETGIWLKMSEDEILTLGNAIVEAYTMTGSKIYASKYAEPGMQQAAEPTYPVSSKVLSLIDANPNIVEDAKKALVDRYYANDFAQAGQRNEHIEPALDAERANMPSAVESGNQEENSKVQAAREEYVSALEGTEDIGVQ